MVSRSYISGLKRSGNLRGLVIVALQVVLILSLAGAGWWIYRRLPASGSRADSNQQTTNLQIVIRQTPESVGPALDVAVSLYPVDIVAVRHEFFTEPPKGKRFEDFLKERMKGRLPVTVAGSKQVIELTPQNAYTRSKTF